MYHCYWLTWTHVPSYAYTYHIVQNSSRGKLWRIWRIWSNSPKFYTPKFASLWLPKKSRSKNSHDVYLEMLSSYKVEAAEEVLMNYTAHTYYIMLIAKCTCAWLHHPLKLLPSALLLCTNSSQPGWFHVETYMRVLGLWFANTAAAEIFIKRVWW